MSRAAFVPVATTPAAVAALGPEPSARPSSAARGRSGPPRAAAPAPAALLGAAFPCEVVRAPRARGDGFFEAVAAQTVVGVGRPAAGGVALQWAGEPHSIAELGPDAARVLAVAARAADGAPPLRASSTAADCLHAALAVWCRFDEPGFYAGWTQAADAQLADGAGGPAAYARAAGPAGALLTPYASANRAGFARADACLARLPPQLCDGAGGAPRAEAGGGMLVQRRGPGAAAGGAASHLGAAALLARLAGMAAPEAVLVNLATADALGYVHGATGGEGPLYYQAVANCFGRPVVVASGAADRLVVWPGAARAAALARRAERRLAGADEREQRQLELRDALHPAAGDPWRRAVVLRYAGGRFDAVLLHEDPHWLHGETRRSGVRAVAWCLTALRESGVRMGPDLAVGPRCFGPGAAPRQDWEVAEVLLCVVSQMAGGALDFAGADAGAGAGWEYSGRPDARPPALGGLAPGGSLWRLIANEPSDDRLLRLLGDWRAAPALWLEAGAARDPPRPRAAGAVAGFDALRPRDLYFRDAAHRDALVAAFSAPGGRGAARPALWRVLAPAAGVTPVAAVPDAPAARAALYAERMLAALAELDAPRDPARPDTPAARSARPTDPRVFRRCLAGAHHAAYADADAGGATVAERLRLQAAAARGAAPGPEADPAAAARRAGAEWARLDALGAAARARGLELGAGAGAAADAAAAAAEAADVQARVGQALRRARRLAAAGLLPVLVVGSAAIDGTGDVGAQQRQAAQVAVQVAHARAAGPPLPNAPLGWAAQASAACTAAPAAHLLARLPACCAVLQLRGDGGRDPLRPGDRGWLRGGWLPTAGDAVRQLVAGAERAAGAAAGAGAGAVPAWARAPQFPMQSFVEAWHVAASVHAAHNGRGRALPVPDRHAVGMDGTLSTLRAQVAATLGEQRLGRGSAPQDVKHALHLALRGTLALVAVTDAREGATTDAAALCRSVRSLAALPATFAPYWGELAVLTQAARADAAVAAARVGLQPGLLWLSAAEVLDAEVALSLALQRVFPAAFVVGGAMPHARTRADFACAPLPAAGPTAFVLQRRLETHPARPGLYAPRYEARVPTRQAAVDRILGVGR
jgi:hypothetical protein